MIYHPIILRAVAAGLIQLPAPPKTKEDEVVITSSPPAPVLPAKVSARQRKPAIKKEKKPRKKVLWTPELKLAHSDRVRRQNQKRRIQAGVELLKQVRIFSQVKSPDRPNAKIKRIAKERGILRGGGPLLGKLKISLKTQDVECVKF